MINKQVVNMLIDKDNIYIYGAGSFGRTVNQLLRVHNIAATGFIDSDVNKMGKYIDELQIYDLEYVWEQDNSFILITSTYFGEIEQLLLNAKFTNYSIIYPQTINLARLENTTRSKLIECDESVIFMDNSKLRNDINFNLGKKVSIGHDSMIDCDFIFESESGKITIGERTYIGAGTKIISRSEIMIGNNVTIAWGCYIYDHNSHSIQYMDRRLDFDNFRADYLNYGNAVANKDWSSVKSQPIYIEDDVWIGFNVKILKGVRIGKGAVIGADSVVTKDVPPHAVIAGNPGVIVKYV